MDLLIKLARLVKIVALLLFLLAIPKALGYEYNPLTLKSSDSKNHNGIPNLSDYEYIQHIRSMVNAYKRKMNNILIETNASIDSKYPTLKRNGDLINSLLALPKHMYEAGR